MIEYLRDAFPGTVAVKFRSHKFDYIGMRLDLRASSIHTAIVDSDGCVFNRRVQGGARTQVPMFFSSVFDPFPDLIHWLEAVTCNVSECSFQWDAEGPSGRLAFQNPHQGKGSLNVLWHRQHGFDLAVAVSQRQLVGAIYQSFRRFVRSDAYDPVNFEDGVRVGDILARANPHGLAEDEIMGHAIMMDRSAVESWLGTIRPGPRYPQAPGVVDLSRLPRLGQCADDAMTADETDEHYTHLLWNRMSTQRRREDLSKSFDCTHIGWGGSNLRKLRSDVIERWLGWVAPEDQAARLSSRSSSFTTRRAPCNRQSKTKGSLHDTA